MRKRKVEIKYKKKIQLPLERRDLSRFFYILSTGENFNAKFMRQNTSERHLRAKSGSEFLLPCFEADFSAGKKESGRRATMLYQRRRRSFCVDLRAIF
jgi:hypothetical protein